MQRTSSRPLAGHLALHPGHVIPAYEDIWQMLYLEQALPVNIDPRKADFGGSE